MSVPASCREAHLCCVLKPICAVCRYDEVNQAVESNLRKQAEVLHGIDANMHAFGDILQQGASSQQVHPQNDVGIRV